MYDPQADFYSQAPVGAGISVYNGGRRQLGGGLFASIQRFAMPIMRHIGKKLLKVAPDIGAGVLHVAKQTISDVHHGRKRFNKAMKSNIRNKIFKKKTAQDILDRQQQYGAGGRKTRKPK